MNNPHFHTLNKLTHGSYKKWVCTSFGCKQTFKRPIDLLGEMIQCAKCASLFTFMNEDLRQSKLIICPVCSGSTDEMRIAQMEVINSQYRDRALAVIMDEALVIEPRKRGRPPKTAQPIVEAATEEVQALTEAMILAGIANIKLKKITEKEETTDGQPNGSNDKK